MRRPASQRQQRWAVASAISRSYRGFAPSLWHWSLVLRLSSAPAMPVRPRGPPRRMRPPPSSACRAGGCKLQSQPDAVPPCPRGRSPASNGSGDLEQDHGPPRLRLPFGHTPSVTGLECACTPCTMAAYVRSPTRLRLGPGAFSGRVGRRGQGTWGAAPAWQRVGARRIPSSLLPCPACHSRKAIEVVFVFVPFSHAAPLLSCCPWMILPWLLVLCCAILFIYIYMISCNTSVQYQ